MPDWNWNNSYVSLSFVSYRSDHQHRTPGKHCALKPILHTKSSGSRLTAPELSFSFERTGQPHRPDSMGMICFFRDMILGRKAQFSSSLWMSKAWRMVFSSPT